MLSEAWAVILPWAGDHLEGAQECHGMPQVDTLQKPVLLPSLSGTLIVVKRKSQISVSEYSMAPFVANFSVQQRGQPLAHSPESST